MTESMRCRLCGGSAAQRFAEAVVLKKYLVNYWRCADCGFVQTDQPHWLNEAYSSAIANIDIGPVNRSVTMAERACALILTFFDSRATFLDFGAGYGIFVRRMRDLGLDFRYFDRYCDNLFAKGFESDLASAPQFEMITAFEVFEHMQEPLAQIRELFSLSDSIFFTTELIREPQPQPSQWWYYSLDQGQHIAFYSRRSLSLVAQRLGAQFYSRGSMHLLTRRALSPRLFRLVLEPKLSPLISLALGRMRGVRSLLPDDFKKISGIQLDQ